jgi:hypothetical protein
MQIIAAAVVASGLVLSVSGCPSTNREAKVATEIREPPKDPPIAGGGGGNDNSQKKQQNKAAD